MKLDFSQVLGAPEERPPKERNSAEKPAVAGYDPLNLERAKKGLAVYDTVVNRLKAEMEKFVVNDEASVAQCTELVARIHGVIKKMKGKLEDTIQDAKAYVNATRAFAKIGIEPMEAAKATGKKKIGAYAYQQELKRREQEAEAQKAADKLQAEMDKKAKKAGIEPVQIPAMVMPRKQTPVRTESGSASTRMVWTWEISDAKQVPAEYLAVDVKAVDAAVKAGIREIVGIKIFERPDVRVRTA